MTVTTPIPRHPEGAPGGRGGEFADRYAPFVDIDLGWRTDGTYAFPAMTETATDLIEFWRTVEIPDRVLRQVTDAHAVLWGAKAGFLGIEFEKANPCPRRADDVQAWRDAKVAYIRERLTRVHPRVIGPGVIRPLVRIARMHWESAKLPTAEREIFRATEFPLPGGTRYKAADLVDFWWFDEMREDFTDHGPSSEAD